MFQLCLSHLGLAGGQRGHSGSVLSHLMSSVAGLVHWVSPRALLSCPLTVVWAWPASKSGQVCPRKAHRTLSVPTGVWRNGSPEWWEMVVSQMQKPKLHEGKNRKSPRNKNSKERFCILHPHCPTFTFPGDNSVIQSQCQMFVGSTRRGLVAKELQTELNLNSVLPLMCLIPS